jgi:hypothetical protein
MFCGAEKAFAAQLKPVGRKSSQVIDRSHHWQLYRRQKTRRLRRHVKKMTDRAVN